jgi:hypothetical protein
MSPFHVDGTTIREMTDVSPAAPASKPFPEFPKQIEAHHGILEIDLAQSAL